MGQRAYASGGRISPTATRDAATANMANPIGFFDEPELIDLPGTTSGRCGSRRSATISFRTHSRAELLRWPPTFRAGSDAAAPHRGPPAPNPLRSWRADEARGEGRRTCAVTGLSAASGCPMRRSCPEALRERPGWPPPGRRAARFSALALGQPRGGHLWALRRAHPSCNSRRGDATWLRERAGRERGALCV